GSLSGPGRPVQWSCTYEGGRRRLTMIREMFGRWIACAVPLSAIALGALGCDRPCEDYFTCPAPSSAAGASSGSGGAGGPGGSGGAGGGYACPDDPSAGEVRGECGLWVSATYGDDANAGTQAAPLKTIHRATELAKTGHGARIYAC